MNAVDGVGSRYQYLESLDSTRMPFRATGDDEEFREISRLQMFSEILMTLVLGREIVVPQPFAFDSYGFHQVARSFLAARDAAGATDQHPFRPHLFGAGIDSFDDAVSSMLARLNDPRRPFVSSAFPELVDHPEGAKSAQWLLRRDWLDDGRRAAFKSVYDEFSGLGRVRTQPYPHFGSLQDLLKAFVDPDSAATLYALGYSPAEREVHDRLVRSIRALDPYRSELGQRSTLRTPAPWPGDPAGRVAAEIVGGQERLDEVIEFVDTLYNAVVVGSIGVATATFSTALATDNDRLAARRIAQHLAIVQYQLRPGEHGRVDDDSPASTNPMFEVREADIGGRAVATNADVRDGIRQLYDSAEDSLPALFQERANRRSPFWTGLEKLRQAQEASDSKEARKALENHVAHVSRILGRGMNVQIRRQTVIGFCIGVTFETGHAFADSFWSLPLPLQVLIGTAGAGIGGAYEAAALGIPARTAGRRRAAALLEIVDL